ncbi:Carboxypeptidase [Thalictrum thalictroides]|uniref:Carboxypeptidase n=1 Tax=Thalictrum thalictroides TaxID=46969 RepID=A0A7J6VE49_THATH|nr:Carboxypeptidase [Thalictrum thalictroides]
MMRGISFFLYLLGLVAVGSHARQEDALTRLYNAKSNRMAEIDTNFYNELRVIDESKVIPQEGLKEKDKIEKLPGQPYVKFSQYGGYVTVDEKAGRAFYYYFTEAEHSQQSAPLLLWLNGGPGCSSLAYGAMQELGPFRVTSDAKSLYRNPYAWNKAANVLFVESPAGLAHTILHHNKKANTTIINLKGIIIGNAVINDFTDNIGMYDYFWTHALISDESIENIHKHCDFSPSNVTTQRKECVNAMDEADANVGPIDIYNIYAPICLSSNLTTKPKKPSLIIDPCSDFFTYTYLNTPEVQKALHANVTGSLNYTWEPCSDILTTWGDSPSTILPLLKEFMANGLRVWVFSGDTDGRVPVTGTRYSLNKLKLPTKAKLYPWAVKGEVGGYSIVYEGGLTFATVRGAGHQVPGYQPLRALTLIQHFLDGITLPKAQS